MTNEHEGAQTQEDKTLNEDVAFGDDELADVPDEVKTKINTLTAQKKHFREKNEKTIREFEEYKKANPVKEEPTSETTTSEHKGLDYSQKAYLKASGIEEEYFSLVEKAGESFGGVENEGVLEQVMNNPYFKSQLDQKRAENEAREASPDGGQGSSSGGQTSVDYWVKKGGLPPLDGTDERIRLRAAIVEARKNKDRETVD